MKKGYESIEDYIGRMITEEDIEQWYKGSHSGHLTQLLEECNLGSIMEIDGIIITGNKTGIVPLNIEII